MTDERERLLTNLDWCAWVEFARPQSDGSVAVRRMPPEAVREAAFTLTDKATQAAQGWMPIESAPRDGTAILVFHPEGGVCEAFCVPPSDSWYCMDGTNLIWDERIGRDRPRLTSFVESPTKWQPLPAPPAVDQREATHATAFATPSAPENGQDIGATPKPDSMSERERGSDCCLHPHCQYDGKTSYKDFTEWAQNCCSIHECPIRAAAYSSPTPGKEGV